MKAICNFNCFHYPEWPNFHPYLGLSAMILITMDLPDIFAVGNFYDVKPDLGRMDARAVCFLKGNGKGNFQYIASQNTGLAFQSQFRDVTLIARPEKKEIGVGRE